MPHANANQTPNPQTEPWSDQLVDLYISNFDKLVCQARRVVQDRYLAEECVQDAFLAVHRCNATPAPGSELAYLRAAVRNRAISVVRRESSQRDRMVDVAEAAEPSAESVAVARLTATELRAEIVQLPERQGAAVALRLQGMTVAQTAEAMQVSSGTVKTHRHRAAENIRRSLVAA